MSAAPYASYTETELYKFTRTQVEIVTTLQNSDNNFIARFMNELDIIIIFKTYYERNFAMIHNCHKI